MAPFTMAWTYDDWTDPAKPATNPLVPDNKVILISSVPNFVMAYGRNTYIDDKTGLSQHNP